MNLRISSRPCVPAGDDHDRRLIKNRAGDGVVAAFCFRGKTNPRLRSEISTSIYDVSGFPPRSGLIHRIKYRGKYDLIFSERCALYCGVDPVRKRGEFQGVSCDNRLTAVRAGVRCSVRFTPCGIQ